MNDLEIFSRHELIRQSRRHKRAAAGHVVMLIGNLAVLFLDRSTPRRGVPRMVPLLPCSRPQLQFSQKLAIRCLKLPSHLLNPENSSAETVLGTAPRRSAC